MRRFVVILALAMAGCERKQQTAPADPAPAANPITGSPKLSGPVSFKLVDGEARHQENPESFDIPGPEDRASMSAGDRVKLVFEIRDGSRSEVERMWVRITGKKGTTFEGLLDNNPYCTDELKSGEPVTFEAKHVIQIKRAE